MYKLMLFLWLPGFMDDYNYFSPLVQLEAAIVRDSVEDVREIVAVHHDLDLNLALRQTCYRYSTWGSAKQLAIMNVLISHGANINHQNNVGYTLLNNPCNLEDPRLVQYLLTISNINPLIKNPENDTAIDIAYKRINAGSSSSPQYLQSIHHVRKHILTKRAERLKEKSDLLAAVEKNDVNRAAYLMNKYPYFTKNYKDADGNTVLHVAIRTAGGSSDLVKHTIAVVPELIGAQNQYGKAPFHNPSVQRLCFRAITGTSQINEKSITV